MPCRIFILIIAMGCLWGCCSLRPHEQTYILADQTKMQEEVAITEPLFVGPLSSPKVP